MDEDGASSERGFKETVEALNSLRLEGKLCDAELVAEGYRFPVHRAILAACSPFFRALFTNGMQETEKTTISIPEVTAGMMKLIIEYAYTRHVQVDSTNVELLLPLADQFHIGGMVQACSDFLIGSLAPENCVGIHRFARHFSCRELERQARHYLEINFPAVAKRSVELLQLDAGELAEILADDELNVASEETAFEAACRWIRYDEADRRRHMPLLLSRLRLGLVHLEYFIEQIAKHPYVTSSDDCASIVAVAWDFLYELERSADPRAADLDSPLVRPRVPHEIVFVVGGWSGGSPTTFLETYDSRADRWYSHPYAADSTPRAYHGLVAVKGKIYILGGFDGHTYFNSVCSFDPETKLWKEAAPMHNPRCYVSAVAVDGYVYACGGYDGRQRLRSAERYDPERNQWTYIAPMICQRSDAGAAALEGRLYVAGGFNGEICLNTAECYDIAHDQWTTITPMLERRSGISLLAFKNSIYALGGFSGLHRLSCGEKYCVKTKTWTPIPEMFTSRSNFASAVLDGMIFVFGGFNGTTTIPHVECYDDEEKEWYDATDMNINRSAVGACTISGLSNVREYSYHGHLNRNGEEGIRNVGLVSGLAMKSGR